MPGTIRIKKGLDIKLIGEANKTIHHMPLPETAALKPTDFPGLVPRLLVQPGDEVKAGTPLLSDKFNEKIVFVSPVSGEVVEVVRGDKRKLMALRILADRETTHLAFGSFDIASSTREALVDHLLKAGVWPFIRQRPYGVVANPDMKPKSIFISGFDTHPLAPDIEFTLQGELQSFQAGVNALRRLTDGAIHVCIREQRQGDSFFNQVEGIEKHAVSGPHPAGNVGIQIHHIDPVSKGEAVWYIHPQDVLVIGRLITRGVFDTTRVIAVTGSAIREPAYYQTVLGTALRPLLDHAGTAPGEHRVISGNVLTGTNAGSDGYLGFYDSQLTSIPEGNEPEFMGWLGPGFNKFSASRTFFSWLSPNKKHDLNTNLHGEERPFVITGQYERVFPMDIYPVQLLKSILVEDIELMEKLGIYEVVEEDFALCEFVCTSKIESQEIIRKGLDIVRKELG